MPTEIILPKVDMDMTSGKIAVWHVSEGTKVAVGTPIFDIETDKAAMEIESTGAGVIHHIVAKPGDVVEIGRTVAWLYAEGEPVGARPGSQPVQAAVPATAAIALPQKLNGAAHSGQDVPAGRHRASPLARKLAKAAGIALAGIAGSGPHGRITRHDVESHAVAKPPAAMTVAAVPVTTPRPEILPDEKVLALYEPGTYDLAPHDNMRRTIAKRLVASKSTVPHFYLSTDCRLDDLLTARDRLNGRSPKAGPGAYKLSVNDFLIKALALALRDVPAANASWTEAGMLRHKRIDVGVAVAVDGGLFTPIIRNADLKTLAELTHEMKDLAERARTRKLSPGEYQGGTTSLSNLGMFGVKQFDAIINPPQATILAVGAGLKQPAVVNDTLTIATLMTATLSCDHRVVDGALGAAVLLAFKGYVEDPVRMLM